jgi:hypothetical protein
MLSKVPPYRGTVVLFVPTVTVEPVPPLAMFPEEMSNKNTALPVPPTLSPTKT